MKFIRIYICFILVVFSTEILAQKAQWATSFSTGIVKGMEIDEALAPYIFDGSSSCFQLLASRNKKLTEQDWSLKYSNSLLRSDVVESLNCKMTFFVVNYSYLRSIMQSDKTSIHLGPAFSTLVNVRNQNENLSGEALSSLNVKIKANRRINEKAALDISVATPLIVFAAYREYSLANADFKLTSVHQVQLFNLNLGYRTRIGEKNNFIGGYELLFYNHRLNEGARIAMQQFLLGLEFKF